MQTLLWEGRRSEQGDPLNKPESTDGRRKDSGRGFTDATVRARIRVDWRLAGGLSALLGVLIAACERDGGIGHGKKHSRTGPGSWRGS